MKKANIEEEQKRFWSESHVNKKGPYMPNMPTRCWQWKLADDGYYGEVGTAIDGKPTMKSAHVVAWQYYGGPRPTRQFPLHHICENKLCVNPGHMAMLTASGHGIMHTIKLVMYCKNGHEMNKENIHIDPKTGRRVCRICDRERKQRQKNAQKSES